MNKALIAQLVFLFAITQALGLFTGNYLVQENIRTVIVSENPEAVENAFGLIAWIIGITVFLLAIIKFAPELLLTLILRSVEALAIMGAAVIVLLPFRIADTTTIGLALLLIAVKTIFSKSVLMRNIAGIIATAGAGALIGASLGTTPLIVLLLLLSTYDFIAVFKTGHMVTLAKGLTRKNISFAFAMPTKEHQFELGTGDIVMPLAFAVSILSETAKAFPPPYSLAPPVAVLAVSLAGIVFTLDYASLKKGTPLPALPLQAALMLIVYAAIKLAGY